MPIEELASPSPAADRFRKNGQLPITPVKRSLMSLNMTGEDGDGPSPSARMRLEFDALAMDPINQDTETTMDTENYDFHNQTTVLIDQVSQVQNSLNISGEFPTSDESSDSFFATLQLGEEAQMGNGTKDGTEKSYCYGCGANFYDPCPCDVRLVETAWLVDVNTDYQDEPFQDLQTEPVILSPLPELVLQPKQYDATDSDMDVNNLSNEDVQPASALMSDPFNDIQAMELGDLLNAATTFVREWIESSTRFGVEFYKISQRGRRHPFIPILFVHIIRNTIPQSQRTFEAPSRFLFPTSRRLYDKVMEVIKDQLKVGTEDPSRPLEHCKQAVLSLALYLHDNEVGIDRFLPPDVAELLDSTTSYDLRSYQKKAIAFAINRDGKCVFADGAGMGKRVEALTTACYYKREWPLLIVCATARVSQWEREVTKYGIKSDRMLVHRHAMEAGEGDDDHEEFRPRAVDLDVDVVIVAYKALQDPGVSKDVNCIEAKVLILDESHRAKHYTTRTTKKVIEICQFARRRLFLTANPTHGTPREFFQQMHLVDPKAFQHYLQFANQYCTIVTTEDGKSVASRNWKDAKNLGELKHLLYGTVLVRHFREDYFTLPVLQREKVLIEFEPSDRHRRLLGSVAYQESIDAHRALELEWHVESDSSRHRTRIFKWYKRSGIAKLIPICSYLDTVDFKNEKVIIYARHLKVMKGIQTFLEHRHVRYVAFAGENYETREVSSALFNVDPEIRAAVLSVDLSNVSINLSSATLVIFAELNWVPDALFRNENRSYELAAAKEVNENRIVHIKYVVAAQETGKSYIDFVLWEMLLGKMDVLRKLDMLRDPFDVVESEFEGGQYPEDFPEFSDMSSDEERDSDEYVPSNDESSDDDPSDDENANTQQNLVEEAQALAEEEGEHTDWRSLAPETRESTTSTPTTVASLDHEAEIEGSSADEEENDSDREFIDDEDAEESQRISTSSPNRTISEGDSDSDDEAEDSDNDDTEIEEDEDSEEEAREIRKKTKGFFF